MSYNHRKYQAAWRKKNARYKRDWMRRKRAGHGTKIVKILGVAVYFDSKRSVTHGTATKATGKTSTK